MLVYGSLFFLLSRSHSCQSTSCRESSVLCRGQAAEGLGNRDPGEVGSILIVYILK